MRSRQSYETIWVRQCEQEETEKLEEKKTKNQMKLDDTELNWKKLEETVRNSKKQ